MSKEHLRLYSAVHLFLIRDEEVLLLRRFNTGWHDGEYSVIAGHLDGGESVTDAMIREAREEGGIDIERGSLKVVHTMNRRPDSTDREYIDFFLTAKDWKGEPKIIEPDKCDDLS